MKRSELEAEQAKSAQKDAEILALQAHLTAQLVPSDDAETKKGRIDFRPETPPLQCDSRYASHSATVSHDRARTRTWA